MNKELAEILKLYSTKSHLEYSNRMVNSSKETIISLFTDLLTMYINDKNSSTLREYITVTVAGYEHSEGKIGFNGFKQNSVVGGKPLACEAKPKNFSTHDYLKFLDGIKKGKPCLLNGGGNFTDYTFSRLAKDTRENPHILVSGFIDGKLIYLIEFPFKTRSFADNLHKQLLKNYPDGKHKVGHFLRSARFDYRSYMKSKNVQVVYLMPRIDLLNYKKFFIGNFYDFLIKKYE